VLVVVLVLEVVVVEVVEGIVDATVGCGPDVVVLMTGAVVTGAASRGEPHPTETRARAPATTR